MQLFRILFANPPMRCLPEPLVSLLTSGTCGKSTADACLVAPVAPKLRPAVMADTDIVVPCRKPRRDKMLFVVSSDSDLEAFKL